MVAYYHLERLFLLKSIRYVLLAGSGEPALSAACAHSLSSLLTAGLEAKMVTALTNNLSYGVAGPPPPADAGSSSSAALAVYSSAAAGLPELPALQREQALRERCELLAILTAIYTLTDTVCPPERVTTIAEALGGAAFHPAAGGAGAAAGGEPAAAGGDVQRFSEYLASVLMLAALRPAALLQALAATHSLAAADAPLAGRLRSVDAALKNWAPCASNAAVLLTWSAYCKLLCDYGERRPLGCTGPVMPSNAMI